jgi:hypothetical protein
MLPISEVMPDAIAQTLFRHNIRFVEQFLWLVHDPAGEKALSQSLDRPVEDLRSLAQRIEAEHPEIASAAKAEEYSLGYGKKSDWKPRGH